MEVALALPLRDGRVLVARRPDGAHLAGYWEFPGGKIERGEAPAAAARRELREETGLTALRWEPLLVFSHDYPDRSIRFHVFLALDARGEPRMEQAVEWAWTRADALARLRMPAANARVVQALARRTS